MNNIIFLNILLLLASSLFAQDPASIPVKPDMILVEGGTFKMGSNDEDKEKPVHSVTLSTFSIGKYEVTVGQYKVFCAETGFTMPDAPEWGWQDSLPMVNVNYNDAVDFCNWLSEKFEGDWRLPTEAEWEYAARGGNKGMGSLYSGGNNLESVAWFAGNAGGKTNIVGRKQPNELGIYDMSGNVWEWCQDWYDKNYYLSSPSSNPQGPSSGTGRVLRGGSLIYLSSYCRVSYRDYHYPPNYRINGHGFRVVLSQQSLE